MNMSHMTPPINNACLPDIYNRLDANVQERTRVMNGQLQMKLDKQEKLIAKYKLEAERFRRRQKYSASKDLSRIRDVPATVSRIPDFDLKFLRRDQGQLSSLGRVPKKKNYLSKTNEDPICQRCYVHHLPTKRDMYRPITPPLPKSTLENVGYKTNRSAADGSMPPAGDGSDDKKAFSAPPTVMQPILTPHPTDLILLPPSPETAGYTRKTRPVPTSKKYQFLERESWGREKNLNDCITPRLMGNEEWKGVVKNVCLQMVRKPKPVRKPSVIWRGPRMNSFVREKSVVAGKSRRTSSRQSGRGRAGSRPSSRAAPPPSRSGSRGDSFVGKRNSENIKDDMKEDVRKLSRDNSSLSAKDMERLRLSSPAKSFAAKRSGSVLKSHKE